ncbi:hypothetical protein [Acinetobacter radioresistens]|uniref:hypothetical protein n=1 Tax=Acinetobacter radioresistens TaxID=40216 RepID=UPI002002B4C6|nr:hypothetical protein [Acinetobacter radioresistens]MCK4108885.1 hypothetical protein [Acinetobacter radioresistens]
MISKQSIKAIALENGFQLNLPPHGLKDLSPYVYSFAAALLNKALDKSIRPGALVRVTDIDEVERLLGTVKVGHSGVLVKVGSGGYYIIYITDTDEITALYSSQFDVVG